MLLNRAQSSKCRVSQSPKEITMVTRHIPVLRAWRRVRVLGLPSLSPPPPPPSHQMPPQTLQFTPFSSLVQPSFWHELTRLKIDVLRLSEDTIEINGSYAAGRSVVDRETGNEIGLGCNLTVGVDAFEKEAQ